MYRLNKATRLTGKNRFARVFRARKVRANRLFRIHHARGSGLESEVGARLGITVSRKVHRLAVERNRIRRQIRESFRLRRRQLKANDYVVRARPAAADADNAALRTALNELWEWFERE
ncbi:MAG: ribonuclease P protein component [Pseudomonadota bacterium]